MKIKNLIFILFFIISIGIIGITPDYFQTTNDADHEIKTSKLGVTTFDTFVSPDNWQPGDITEKILYVTNNGNEDIAVRLSLEEEWKSKNNEILSNTQNSESIAIIDLVNPNDWVKIGNYYYYKYKVKKNESTSNFMNSITFNPNIDFDSNCITTNNINNCSYSIGDYEGATYNLNIKIETIDYNKYQTVWNPSITLLDEKPLTGTAKLVKKANNASITTYSNGDTHEMYTFSHEQTEQTPALTDYRYIGNDPYNYVYFNCDNLNNQNSETCEVWRIIGVFDVDDGTGNIEQRMKLVRGLAFAKVMKFNSIYNNDWTVSSVNTFLNGDYYNQTGNAELYGLKTSAQNMIGDALYYLGSVSYDSTNYTYGDTEKNYAEERGNVICGACESNETKLTWTGKIGLMYPSDEYMVYGNGVNEVCYTTPNKCLGTHAQTGWIIKSNIREGQTQAYDTWFLTSIAGTSGNVTYSNGNGNLENCTGWAWGLNIRPVVYLKSDIKITSGTGEVGSPYVLSN